MVITKRMVTTYTQLLNIVGDKVQLSTGFVRKLYTTDGTLIKDKSDLKSNQCYVAVGRGRFKPRSYTIGGRIPGSPTNSPRRAPLSPVRGAAKPLAPIKKKKQGIFLKYFYIVWGTKPRERGARGGCVFVPYSFVVLFVYQKTYQPLVPGTKDRIDQSQKETSVHHHLRWLHHHHCQKFQV